MSPYVRTVKPSSGATAVQIVYSSGQGSREIEQLGSAHSGAEVELLKAAARQRLAAGQGELDLGLDTAAPGGPLPITASRMGCLLDALGHLPELTTASPRGNASAIGLAAAILKGTGEPLAGNDGCHSQYPEGHA